MRPRLFLPLTLCLLASALRFYQLGTQAFRGDEGFTVIFAAQAWDSLFAAMAHTDPNPPLYILLMRGWLMLAGNSEVAARLPSALASIIGVALTYRLARQWLTPRVGAVAALLVALNPFLLWYAQDARAYALWGALTLWALGQTHHAFQRGTFSRWFWAGLAWWLALFTHYFTAFSLLLVGLWALLSPHARQQWRPALITALSVSLAYLPWALYVAPFLLGHQKGWIAPVPAWDALWRVGLVQSVGLASYGVPSAWQVVAGLSSLALLALGLWALRRHPTALWLALLGPGLPLLLWLVALARPVFIEQYFYQGLPLLLIVTALGLTTLPRLRFSASLPISRYALVLPLALAPLFALTHLAFDPRQAKAPDWHSVVRYLADTARPNEIVLINLPDPAFTHYYTGPMPMEAAPPAALATLTTAEAEAQLVRVRDTYQHIRFFFSPSPLYDPQGFVGHWLEQCCEKTEDRFVAGFRVLTFDTPTGSLAAQVVAPLSFNNGLRLTGYRVPNPTLAPGDTLRLTLFWATQTPLTETYTVFIHVLAPDGFNVISADAPPRWPTTQWTPGQPIIDPHPFALPPDIPPGQYRLEVGLYEPNTGQRLTGPNRDALILPQTISVVAP